MRKTRIGVLSLLLAAAMLLAACGGASTSPEAAPMPTGEVLPELEREDSPAVQDTTILGVWRPQQGEAPEEIGDFFYEFTEDGRWIVYRADGAEVLQMSFRITSDLVFSEKMVMRFSRSGDQLILEDTQEPYGRFVLDRAELPARENENEAEEAVAPAPEELSFDGVKKAFEAILYVTKLKELEGKSYSGKNDQTFVADATKQAFRWEDEEDFRFPGEAEDPCCCASAALAAYWVNGSREGIPLGAAVYFSGNRDSCPDCGRDDAGHVGIYLGDGQVIHCSAVYANGVRCEHVIRIDSIDEILNEWGYRYEGWGWESGYQIPQNGQEVMPQVFLSVQPGDYPDEIVEGEVFHVSGTVTVDDSGVLRTVRGDILDRNGRTVIDPAAEFPVKNGKTYDLYPEIDAALKFGELRPGQYTYRVTATVFRFPAREAVTLLERTFYVVAKDAPAISNGKATKAGHSSAAVSWDDCPGAVSYEVQYESPVRPGEWITDSSYSTGTEYVSTGLQQYDNWRFRVHAVFGDGTVSRWTVIPFSKTA